MTVDDGYLTNTERLPVMAVSLSGTGFYNLQYQYITLGPLQCFQCDLICLSHLFVSYSKHVKCVIM